MIGANLVNIVVTCLLAISVSSIMVSESASNGPLVFTKWPPVQQNRKPESMRRQMFHHLRSSGRIPSNMITRRYPSFSPSQRIMRPVKMSSMTTYIKKGQISAAPSYYKPSISSPPRHHFQSSVPAPNSGEYVFENPFANVAIQPNKKKVSITDEYKYNPIHTIPAPNLNLAYSPNAEHIHESVDNHLAEKDQMIAYRPLNIHQYQVTESTNDLTIRDSLSGKQKMYAPDPDASMPSYKISPPMDMINQPNNVVAKPLPLEIHFVPAPSNNINNNEMETAPITSSLVHLSNAVPQQQLPDTYALPIANQPQLQQHILQQQSILHGVPVSVYNPTYLVTQSNNLLNQHRERLFKPAPAFLGTINQPTIDMSPREAHPLQDVNSVASPGQILSSAQNQQKQQQLTPSHNTIPIRNDIATSISSSNNSPTFQRFTAQKTPPPSNNDVIMGQTSAGSHVQQPLLTEQEVANLMNFGSVQNNAQEVDGGPGGFIASSFYQTHPDPQIEIENRYRQQLNDLTISQANAEVQQKQNLEVSTTAKPNSEKSATHSAHEQHQQKLAEQFGAKTSLMIYVPDDDYQNKNDLRRSDNFSKSTTEDISSGEVDERSKNQNFSDEINEVTTDGSEEYFSHDTESVDRLAMDGETAETSSSNTIHSYNY